MGRIGSGTVGWSKAAPWVGARATARLSNVEQHRVDAITLARGTLAPWHCHAPTLTLSRPRIPPLPYTHPQPLAPHGYPTSISPPQPPPHLPAAAVVLCNRCAAYMADKKAIRGLADAQRAAIFDPTNWKAHWRTGLSLMMLAPRLERTEQAITAFEVRVVVGKEHGIGRERFKECVLSCSAVARAHVIV